MRFARAQGLVRSDALGDVAGHLGEALELPGCIPERRQGDMGHEGRAVLAQAQALLLVASDLARQSELPLRPAGRDPVLGVEHGEGPAHDLVRGPARDALRTGVPARDAAVAVQHDDREVGDGIDEETEPDLRRRRRRDLLVR
jgi:hypothetical protein